MVTFLIDHQFWAAVGLYWFFSAAVSAMPEPMPDGAPAYVWFFRFLHSIAGNITTVFGGRIPGIKSIFLLLFLLPLGLSASACAAAHYTVHPAALNTTDSMTYDTLLVAEAAIDNARADYEAGRLPDGTKPAFNTLVRSYNVAHGSWLTYRSALAASQPSAAYFNRLDQNLIDLSNALRAFAEAEAQ